MGKLKVCFSLFVENSQRDQVAAELTQPHEESGKNLVRSQDENIYGVIDKGVLYIRRIFPVTEET